jgi:membrane protein required for beta-lactamase induction
MAFVVPELPYPKEGLEPAISRETVETHFEKHHKGYATKLNALTQGKPEATRTLDELVRTATGPIFNNAAQVSVKESAMTMMTLMMTPLTLTLLFDLFPSLLSHLISFTHTLVHGHGHVHGHTHRCGIIRSIGNAWRREDARQAAQMAEQR